MFNRQKTSDHYKNILHVGFCGKLLSGVSGTAVP